MSLLDLFTSEFHGFFCVTSAVNFVYFVCHSTEEKKDMNMQWGELLNPSSQSGRAAKLSHSQTVAQKSLCL